MRQAALLLLLLLACLPARSQDSTGAAGEEAWQERFFRSDETLPLLMEAAISYSAEIERVDLGRNIAREDLKIKQKEIFSGIGLGSGYTYGTRIGLGTGETQQQNQLNAFVLPAQAQYNVGVMLALPISHVLNRGNELSKQKMVVQQAEADRKIKERQLRQLVIGQYQEVVMARAQVKLHQEAYQTINIHHKLAEKQFAKGEISLSEMARISETYAAAATAQGTSQVRYATAFLMMEELIGKKIKDLMTQQ
ncbi:MAG: TolC family protein [Adhaeribacter sp.]